MRKVFIILLFFLLFLLRMQFVPRLGLKEGQVVKVTGRLTEEPQISGNQQKFNLGKFSVTTERWPEYHYGEKIVLTGEIKNQRSKIKNTDKKSKIFSDFLVAENYLMNYPKIVEVDPRVDPPGSTKRIDIKKLAIWIRLRMREVFNKSLPKPLDGIASGIVIGDKSLISFDFWQQLKLTGVLHIMVASGSNIAMFSEGLLSVLCILFLRKISLLFLICLIWFYTMISGFQLPIIRAAIMASLLYGAEFFGRKKEGKNILWLTGGIMAMVSPQIVFDVGFQLSFLATAGLVYIQPIIKKRNWSLFKVDNFSSSIAAFLATTPILVLNFGQFNLLSPLINLAVLWTIPFILQIGMVIGLIGLMGQIGLSIAGIFAYLLYPLLFYLEKVISWSAGLTFFQISLPKISFVLVIIYYLGLWWWVKTRDSYVKKN